MENIPKRVAIVYDWVDKWGGAEQILLALHQVFPDAPLFTLFHKPQKTVWVNVFPKIYTSFLQGISFLPRQILIAFAPIAFESFRFTEYDLVISVTSHFAKGIITSPKTTHYSICLTPPRYLYLHQHNYRVFFLLKPFENLIKKYLIYWDKFTVHRPDKIFAISKTVQKRISTIYNLKSELLYPPVKVESFYPGSKEKYFLYLGRLESYKNPMFITQVFNKLKLPLVVAGSGSLLGKIRQIAKPNIKVLGEVSEADKISLLQRARALIFYHEEDFGIVPVEAMASGTPVIGLNRGGIVETVIHGKTGLLIDDFSPKALSDAIINFQPNRYLPRDLISQAEKFSYESFVRTCSVWR